MKKHKKALFIFRRDLRIDDNTGLIKAHDNSELVLTCFIIDPRQIEKNEYRSENAIQFMTESLLDLQEQIDLKGGRLFFFSGKAHNVVEMLIESQKIDAVYLNRDYTIFSIERDKEIRKVCKDQGIPYFEYCDSLLNEPEDVLKKDGTPYTIFTPFYKNSIIRSVSNPLNNNYSNYYIGDDKKGNSSQLIKLSEKKNKFIHLSGGRKNFLEILGNMNSFKRYEFERDIPSKNSTTNLSAHLKFGTGSIREVFNAIKKNLDFEHPLIRQLYWRDFYTHIAFHFPHVFGSSFKRKYDMINWMNNEDLFKSWSMGETGFPIVDAGMRQLNKTGFMHNRVRMITASFLTKDLHIDWRWGEKYFARKLVDYDPSVNNGNWQWASSTGCDAQPYFRIFNPWLQQKKYDPDSVYIKKWIPELKETPSKVINNLFKFDKIEGKIYPKPIVNHEKESKFSKFQFREL